MITYIQYVCISTFITNIVFDLVHTSIISEKKMMTKMNSDLYFYVVI